MANNALVHGRSTTQAITQDSGKFQLEEINATGNSLHTKDDSVPTNYSVDTATGVVSAVPGYYHGYIVTTALSAAAITLYDNASAASGNVIDVIPASTTAGTRGVLPVPVPVANGIYASFGGTGTVVFLYS